MAFIDNDTVKELRRIFLIVDDRYRRPVLLVPIDFIFYIFILFGQFITLQDRVHSLDRADINLIGWRHDGLLQKTYAKDIREHSLLPIWHIGSELLLCLYPQGFCIYEKKNPVHLPVSEQAICLRDRGERLPRTGSHLYESFRSIFSKRSVQICNGNFLAFTKSGRIQDRHVFKIIPNSIRSCNPVPKCLRLVE